MRPANIYALITLITLFSPKKSAISVISAVRVWQGSLFLERIAREQHGTFEDYCRERWGMTGRHANRLVGAAEVVGYLGPIGPIPETESQARPLASLPADLQPVVWDRAVTTAPDGKLTASLKLEKAR